MTITGTETCGKRSTGRRWTLVTPRTITASEAMRIAIGFRSEKRGSKATSFYLRLALLDEPDPRVVPQKVPADVHDLVGRLDALDDLDFVVDRVPGLDGHA